MFIGTGSAGALSPVSNGAGGSTIPGAAYPFGMVQWGPDTPNAQPLGYAYEDNETLGFSLTHLSGAGCTAMLDFRVLPLSGDWDLSHDPREGFAHAQEIASPGFYEVTLDSGTKVDLTATQRTGFGRFTFAQGKPQRLMLVGRAMSDALHTSEFEIGMRSDGVISGRRIDALFCFTGPAYPVYFAARFDRPFSKFGSFSQAGMKPGERSITGTDGGVYFDFDASGGRAVQMKIGLSYVSAANALMNLDAEDAGWDFDAVHAAAVTRWNDLLGRAAVEGGSEDDRAAFYTALYHAFLQPAAASDINGEFMGFDGVTHKAEGYVRYQNFSGWDIYRTWVQLVSILAPAEAADILRSFFESGKECGALPKWSLANTETSVMVGDPGILILANGYAFGGRGFDESAALDLMRKSATDPSAACNGRNIRPGLDNYLSRHFCPADDPKSPTGPASTTVEYAVADFALGQFAGALGDGATKAAFIDRGRYWRNVFDPTWSGAGFSGYLQPRLLADAGGSPAFQNVDVAMSGSGSGFVEGNAAQYTLTVPHDVPGLIALLGGEAQAIARLDAFFTHLNDGLSAPYFYMGNEPGFSTPWMYAFAGAPWKTQAVVRRILKEAYSTKPAGLPGNDDLGSMSSWQAWAMLGLYPAIPGVGGFVVGSPTFSKVTLALGGGKTLVITGTGAAPDAPYVQALSLDGVAVARPWIPWSALSGGAHLDFTLGTMPNPDWGAKASDRPPAFY